LYSDPFGSGSDPIIRIRIRILQKGSDPFGSGSGSTTLAQTKMLWSLIINKGKKELFRDISINFFFNINHFIHFDPDPYSNFWSGSSKSPNTDQDPKPCLIEYLDHTWRRRPGWGFRWWRTSSWGPGPALSRAAQPASLRGIPNIRTSPSLTYV